MALVTSFRMYEAGPGAAKAWRALFDTVFSRAGVQVDIIEHRWPTPIAALWAEPQLCCAFMCGWPFVRAATPMTPIAVPVPSPPRYEDQPRYCSEFLVREASGWTTLEATFGHRFGWMARDSQSGFNAPRAHLAQYVTPERRALYAEVRGPLGSPMAALDALARGDVDVIALDSFWLDLCRRHVSERLAGVRTVATTEWMPIPLLVAAPAVDAAVVERLRAVLVKAHGEPALVPKLTDCLVRRFVVPDMGAYVRLEAASERANAIGYAEIR